MPQSQMIVRRASAPVREQVVENLRNAIIDNRFAPGDRLREKELCELTGTSRTSVREALRQLESEGLVEVIPNVGPVVTVMTLRVAREIYEVRERLEGLAGRLSAERATDKEITELGLIVEQYAAASPDDYDRLLAIKADFYDMLLRMADNNEISRTLQGLRARVTSLRRTTLKQPGRFDATVRELREIFSSISSRDAQRADDACSDHVKGASATAFNAWQ